MRCMAPESVDAIVTDPPYGLAFMGKRWDYDVPAIEVWSECLRILKPGGHLLAFAGTRTQHRMAVRIEDAGFEIRDMIAWVYGSGFPKSLDVSKAIDKRGGSIPWQAEFAEHLRAIKPAGLRAADINAHITNGSKSNFWGHFIDTKCQPLLPTLEQYRKLRELLPIDPVWDHHFLPEAEREVVGQKRTGDPVAWYAQSDRGDGVVDITAPATPKAQQWQGWGTALKPALEPITVARKPFPGTVAANVLEHGTGALNVDGCRVDGVKGIPASPRNNANGGDSGGVYGRYEPPSTDTAGWDAHAGRWPANLIHDGSDDVIALFPNEAGAAAPVYVRNTDKFRNSYGTFAGNVDEKGSTFHNDVGSAARFFYCAKASRFERDDENLHPTVKPIDLMRYLCRLVTPPGGLVLDPFMGSGTTGIAARLEGFRFAGIEREPEYLRIAAARLKRATAQQTLFDLVA